MNTIEMLMPEEWESLISAQELNELYPLTQRAIDTVLKWREEFGEVFTWKVNKIIMFGGPCGSRLDKKNGRYSLDIIAEKLWIIREKVRDLILLWQRVNWEKPRTTDGYRWIAIDWPYNGFLAKRRNTINENLKNIWRIYSEILDKYQVPMVSEFLSPNIAKSLSPLVSFGWTWARNCEAQINRELLNLLLKLPFGIKHTRDGNIENAINTLKAIFKLRWNTEIWWELKWNEKWHIILRWSEKWPNFSPKHIREVMNQLEANDQLNFKIWIDTNHKQSRFDPTKQPNIVKEVCKNPNVSFTLSEVDLFEGMCP